MTAIRRSIVFGVLGFVASGCGTNNNKVDAGATVQMTIQNFTYSPGTLTVAPGTTISIQNLDSMSHTVTSESTQGAFLEGAVNGVQFDSGTIGANTTVTLTIPASAPVGTTVPFFCKFHHGMMMPSAPSITISH